MKRNPVIAFWIFIVLTLTLGAQTKPPAAPADFGPWESMMPAGGRGGLSPDGRWLAYSINRSNGQNELRVVKIAGGEPKIAPFGAQAVFSEDSKWIAYSIGLSEADQEKLRKEQKPIQNKFGLLNLATGEVQTWEAIESFGFSADGAYLAMRHYAPRPAAPAGGAAGGSRSSGADDEDAPGTTVIVRQLATGRDTTFGNVSQFLWQDSDSTCLLAMTISAEGKSGNGVQLFDPRTGLLRVLDSSASTYTGLVWRKDAADLAVLRAKADERREGSTHVVLAWRGIGKAERANAYDPVADSTFPAGSRIVSFRRLSWSDTGAVLFFGLANWEEKIGPPTKEAKAAKEAMEPKDPKIAPASAPQPPAKTVPPVAPAAGTEDPSTVEIWHARDVDVMPLQKNRAAQDRRRNILAAWHIDAGRLVRLGRDPVNEQVTPIRGTNLAYVAEWSKYAFDRTIGRPAADLYLADIQTGARTKIREAVNDAYIQAGPAGKYLIFLDKDHFWTVHLTTRAVVNITKSAPVSFIDFESDATTPAKPPFGPPVWIKDDAAVLLYDKYDIWKAASDGSKVQKMTAGAAEEIRHRLVRLDTAGFGFGRGGDFGSASDDKGVDLAKPQYLSLYGEWTKKSGYARLAPGGLVTRLVWLDRGLRSLAKAKSAEVYDYIVQDFDVSPNVLVGGPELKDARPATQTNPFQSKFAWGRSELLDYKTDKGRRLQAALFYPAGYQAGKKYPMIVYTYELLSQNLHTYVVPSERSYYNISVFTAMGYFVLTPDIVFRPRQPGWSVVECVTAGVKKVIDLGLVDPLRIGTVGHSMGGFNASFLATHTDGVFAAAVAGAPITDMVSYYGDHHWGTGIAETDHIETGQERMVVPLYEGLKDYMDNSAYFNVHNMTVPLLLEAGDQDGIIAWHQSIGVYNVARRAGKNVVLLGYLGEDHGLRQAKNQIDYQKRILAWFGHYLKGEPAEPWIVKGQSFLDREAEIKRLTTKK